MGLKTSIVKRSSRSRIRKNADGTTTPFRSKGGWFWRIHYFDDGGNARVKERGPYRTKQEAKDFLDIEAAKLGREGGRTRESEKLTFEIFAIRCETDLFSPATLINGHWEGGIRSSRSARSLLTKLRSYFGKFLLNEITKSDLQNYRARRIKDGVSSTTVNRELAILRQVMRHAFGSRLITEDPFEIKKGSKNRLFVREQPRDRLLTLAEEERLLHFSSGEHLINYERKWKGRTQELSVTKEVGGPHLRALIILALDTGARKNELLSLTWADIDFLNNEVRIMGAYTKALTPRKSPLSDRAAEALRSLQPANYNPSDKVFLIADFKRSWATAKRLAKIDGLRFHDLRRAAIVGMLKRGISPLFVAEFVGHKSADITLRHYTAVNSDIIQDAADRMNAEHSSRDVPVSVEVVQ